MFDDSIHRPGRHHYSLAPTMASSTTLLLPAARDLSHFFRSFFSDEWRHWSCHVRHVKAMEYGLRRINLKPLFQGSDYERICSHSRRAYNRREPWRHTHSSAD